MKSYLERKKDTEREGVEEREREREIERKEKRERELRKKESRLFTEILCREKEKQREGFLLVVN